MASLTTRSSSSSSSFRSSSRFSSSSSRSFWMEGVKELQTDPLFRPVLGSVPHTPGLPGFNCNLKEPCEDCHDDREFSNGYEGDRDFSRGYQGDTQNYGSNLGDRESYRGYRGDSGSFGGYQGDREYFGDYLSDRESYSGYLGDRESNGSYQDNRESLRGYHGERRSSAGYLGDWSLGDGLKEGSGRPASMGVVRSLGDGYFLSVDVSQFEPHDVVVLAYNHNIVIKAEKITDDGVITDTFTHKSVLAADMDPLSVSSTLTPEGVLVVSVQRLPLPRQPPALLSKSHL